jgi:hypothetical protein
MSAFMWQVAQQRAIKHYGKLEEFVTVVTQTVPELMTDRQRTLLILGLRARVRNATYYVIQNPFNMLGQSHLKSCHILFLNGL